MYVTQETDLLVHSSCVHAKDAAAFSQPCIVSEGR